MIVAGENLKSRITSDGSAAAWGAAAGFTRVTALSPLTVVGGWVVGAAAVVVCDAAVVELDVEAAVVVLVDVVVLLRVLVSELELVVEAVAVESVPELAWAEITGRDSGRMAIAMTIAMRAWRREESISCVVDARTRQNLPWSRYGRTMHIPTRSGEQMSRLIRMDRTGHTTLAEWRADDPAGVEAAVAAFRAQLEQGYFAVVSHGEGQAEQVHELPRDAPLVILRRPIAGG